MALGVHDAANHLRGMAGGEEFPDRYGEKPLAGDRTYEEGEEACLLPGMVVEVTGTRIVNHSTTAIPTVGLFMSISGLNLATLSNI